VRKQLQHVTTIKHKRRAAQDGYFRSVAPMAANMIKNGKGSLACLASPTTPKNDCITGAVVLGDTRTGTKVLLIARSADRTCSSLSVEEDGECEASCEHGGKPLSQLLQVALQTAVFHHAIEQMFQAWSANRQNPGPRESIHVASH